MSEQCMHEELNLRGRCVKCNKWAVLTGQVPVPTFADPDAVITVSRNEDERLAEGLAGWGHDHQAECCREHGTHSMPHVGCILR